MNVLVTGIGNGVGQSIAKSLQISKFKIKIFVADIDKYCAGIYRFPNRILIPKVETDKSLDQIKMIIKEHKIELLLIGSEYETEFFAKNRIEIENETSTKILVSDLDTVKLGNNKWLTAEFLNQNDIPTPRTCKVNLKSDREVLELTNNFSSKSIIKPIGGTSSKDIYIIENHEDYRYYSSKFPDSIIQLYIENSSRLNEYTSSYFRGFHGELIGPFVLRRQIKNGTSWIAQIEESDKFKKLLDPIISKINFLGSINIQLLENDKELKVMEINTRFSGTTSIRSLFGFNEPEMAIKSLRKIPLTYKKKFSKGTVFRYHEEIVIRENISLIGDSEISAIRGHKRQWF
jgi:carbamoyl-phosphate synthase large subunit